MFGPTPVAFFGYPQNRNLASSLCGNCWWTTDRWATQCPRGMHDPECMVSHTPEQIADSALALAEPVRMFGVAAVHLVHSEALNNAIDVFANRRPRGGVLLGPAVDVQTIQQFSGSLVDVTYFVPAEQFGLAREQFGHAYRMRPYGVGSIPINSASLNWVLTIGGDPVATEFLQVCLDTLRCLSSSGRGLICFEMPPGHSEEDVRRALVLVQSRIAGKKYALNWTEEAQVVPVDETGIGQVWLLLEVIDQLSTTDISETSDAPIGKAQNFQRRQRGGTLHRQKISDALESHH